MATSMLSSHLRRSRQSFFLPVLSQLINPNRLTSPPHPRPPLPPPAPPPFDTCRPHFRPRLNSLAFLGAFPSRAFSTWSPDDDSTSGKLGDNLGSNSQLDLEPLNGIEQVTNGEDPIFPVRALITMLDGFHDLTGCPW